MAVDKRPIRKKVEETKQGMAISYGKITSIGPFNGYCLTEYIDFILVDTFALDK